MCTPSQRHSHAQWCGVCVLLLVRDCCVAVVVSVTCTSTAGVALLWQLQSLQFKAIIKSKSANELLQQSRLLLLLLALHYHTVPLRLHFFAAVVQRFRHAKIRSHRVVCNFRGRVVVDRCPTRSHNVHFLQLTSGTHSQLRDGCVMDKTGR
jgi:uncharacterized membrane protein YwzB